MKRLLLIFLLLLIAIPCFGGQALRRHIEPETANYGSLFNATQDQFAINEGAKLIKYNSGLSSDQITDRFDILLRRKLAFNIYANWPSTANRFLYFDGAATGDGYQAGSNPNLAMTFNNSTGALSYIRKTFPQTPTKISTLQALWQIRTDAGITKNGDVLNLRFRDKDGTALVNLTVTFGDQSGDTGTASFKLTTNLDSTGYTKADILVKSGGLQVQTFTEIRANPATGKSNFGIGRYNSTDLGDGITQIEHESVSTTDLDYSGDIYDAEVSFIRSANYGQLDIIGFSVAENPFVQIGDSISTNLYTGIGKQSTTKSLCMYVPYLYLGRGGRYLHSVDDEGYADNTHWAKLTYEQGYRRVVLGNIGSNDYARTNSAEETNINGYFATILADLKSNEVSLDRVIVHTISPKGATNPRNAPTITAVQNTNTYISGLATNYGFGFYDNYTLMRDGATDNWQAIYTTDGTHPATFAGYTKIASGLYDVILWGAK